MAQTELFKRYIWLVDLIYHNDGITRDEINRQWSSSSVNDRKESEIPERTFHRHKEAIKELFDLEIVCNRHGDRSYHIANRDNLKEDVIKEWLLNTFAVNNIISDCQDLKARIIFEPIPSGQQFLTPILEAMRDNNVITINYQSFHMESPAPHEVEPYCLKIYKQRWYLIGRRTDTDAMRTFSLDRIKSINVTNKSFLLPADFNAEDYFKDCIGIIVDDKYPAQTVEILVSDGQQDYFRSLPIHSSQQEIIRGDGSSHFTLFVQPNYDLIQELLRYGEDVEVLRPKWFREEFHKITNKMNHNYHDE